MKTMDYTTRGGLNLLSDTTNEKIWENLFQKLMKKFNRTAEQVANGFFSTRILEHSILPALKNFFQDRVLTKYFAITDEGRNVEEEINNSSNIDDICDRVLSDRELLTNQKNVLPPKENPKEGRENDTKWYFVEKEPKETHHLQTKTYEIRLHHNSTYSNSQYKSYNIDDQYVSINTDTSYNYEIRNWLFWYYVFEKILIFKLQIHREQQQSQEKQITYTDLKEVWNPERVRDEFAWRVSVCRKMRFRELEVSEENVEPFVNAGNMEPFVQQRNKQIETIVMPKFEDMIFEDWGEEKPEAKLTEYLSFIDSTTSKSVSDETDNELNTRANECLSKCKANALWYMEKKIQQTKYKRTEGTVNIATIRVVHQQHDRKDSVFKYIKLQENPQTAEVHYYLIFYLNGYDETNIPFTVDQVIGPIKTGQHDWKFGTPFTHVGDEGNGILWQQLNGSKIVTMLEKMFQLLNYYLPHVAPANFFVIRPKKSTMIEEENF